MRYNVWCENVIALDVEFTGSYEECVKFIEENKDDKYYRISNLYILEEK